MDPERLRVPFGLLHFVHLPNTNNKYGPRSAARIVLPVQVFALVYSLPGRSFSPEPSAAESTARPRISSPSSSCSSVTGEGHENPDIVAHRPGGQEQQPFLQGVADYLRRPVGVRLLALGVGDEFHCDHRTPAPNVPDDVRVFLLEVAHGGHYALTDNVGAGEQVRLPRKRRGRRGRRRRRVGCRRRWFQGRRGGCCP